MGLLVSVKSIEFNFLEALLLLRDFIIRIMTLMM